jgi:hypothetical protein
MGSYEVVLMSFLVKCVLAMGAWLMLRFALGNLDNLAGFSFKTWINNENGSDVGKGIYLGARIFAMAYLFSSILS